MNENERHDVDGLYYGRDGKPISQEQWLELWEDNEGRRIGWDEVGGYSISTVWLGINHSFGDGPPMIFETMIFGGDAKLDGWQRRYPTLEAAEAGHQEAIRIAGEDV